VIGDNGQVVGDNVSMLHSVNLGGTGKERKDSDPKIGNGAVDRAGQRCFGQYL